RAILDAHGLDYQLDWELSGQPFFTPPGRILDAIREAIERHAHIRPQLSTSGGTSDGRFIATLCDEVIEFGPLNATIHKIDEHIDLAHFDLLTAIYHDTLARLLAP
ncbi:MAG: M20/M25/M40 family metallo-hydrolase, partial [Rhodocyclaceae bacterium]|nr:M20/M25/M40 family metallo-hydrolase [Rhodocyclaceae bacterium]